MNRGRLKKIEEKINTRSQKSFCVFQDGENGVIKYNNEEYENLEAFKNGNDVSDLDKMLIVRFLR